MVRLRSPPIGRWVSCSRGQRRSWRSCPGSGGEARASGPWPPPRGFLLITLTRPRWLHPLNRAWMAFGFVANIVMSSVLMAVIFYGVITPLACVLRRAGQDPLRLRFDSGVASYWLERRPPGPAPETMKNQF